MFPALQAANLAEFHAITFAPAPLLFAYHYGAERAWKRYALFSLVALAVKEDVALLVFAMAVYFAVKLKGKRQKAKLLTFNFELLTLNRVPILIAALALVWFVEALRALFARRARGERGRGVVGVHDGGVFCGQVKS